MQREKFVDGLRSGIKFTDAERNEIVNKAVEHCGIETTGIICMEEMAELQQQISKYLRGCGDRLCLLEEMADVYICLKDLEKIFAFYPDQILKAIDVKLLREKGRIKDVREFHQ